MKKNFLFFTFCFINLLYAQTKIVDTVLTINAKNTKFHLKQIIIPTILVSYGIVGLNNTELKRIDLDIRNEVQEDNHKKIKIDDFLQFTPAVSVYALNNLGVEGKHNLKGRTVILGTSMVLVLTSITILKRTTNINRPDGTQFAFPSGHTAVAFAGAEFLYQEYKDKSIWYGISGYVIATATAGFRIYNNKHWLTDVIAGAGIGILSTKAAYWMSPYLNNKIFKSKAKNYTSMISPYYDGNAIGGSFIINF